MGDMSQRARLKPLVVHIIGHWEAEMAADMILSLVLNEAVLNAPLADPRKRKNTATAPSAPRAPTTRGNGNGQAAAADVPLDEIDPNKRYTRREAAELLRMGLVNFTVWYAKPGNIEVIREEDLGGRSRVFFSGAELIRVRDRRNGTKAVA